jgi:hypothetical protein
MANKLMSIGQFNAKPGDGFLAPIHFPSLMSMDSTTPDGREMASKGMGARALPFAIMGQFQTAPGHDGAFVVGTLQEVTFWDDGNVEGWGWLVDTDEGRKMHTLLKTGALRQNSVDLADVTYEIRWKSDDPADGEDFWTIDKVLFTEWKIATTTFVNIPAFPDAHGELTASVDLEVFVDVPTELTEVVTPMDVQLEELTASVSVDAEFECFHVPEPDHPQGVHINDDGWVSFHLAEWGKPHRGHQGRNVYAPRPVSYASFHQGGVDTERGRVKTGPVFFLGGHPDQPLESRHGTTVEKAYGGIENAWCDVRTTNGRFGPWCCGRLRPGVSDTAIYAAKASGVSGHWLGDDLLAIASVNVPGFETDEPDNVVCFPGSTLRADRDGGRITEDGQLELVASLRISPQAERERVAASVAENFAANGVHFENSGAGYEIHVQMPTTVLDDELSDDDIAVLLADDELPLEALVDNHS